VAIGTDRFVIANPSGNLSHRSTRQSVNLELPFPSNAQCQRFSMRNKLLTFGPEALNDDEMLEMLLFFVVPSGDTKTLASALIDRFGSFAAVLTASPWELFAARGLEEQGVAAFKLVQGAAIRLAKAEVVNRPILGAYDRLIGYLNTILAREPIEQFRVLFLDSKNRLIADEILGRGTVNHTPVYPREVGRRALELYATAIILVHNHPSGDPEPSSSDINITQDIKRVTNVLSIQLHDHIIIGNGCWCSLREKGLL